MKRVILSLLTLLSFVSCRRWVLEDRLQCPSFLFFDVVNEKSFKGLDDVYVNVYSSPGGLFVDEAEVTLQSIAGKEFYFTVRSMPVVMGVGALGYGTLVRDSNVFTAPPGQDYAPFFRFAYEADVQEESFAVPVEFVKDFTHVTVQFVGFETFLAADGLFPFDVVVRGNTNGMDALTGHPQEGPYEYRPEEGQLGCFDFNLPRLANKQLCLEIYGREGISDQPGYVRSFDLYELLTVDGGITWTEKNLPDVRIEIDFVQWEVTVGVSPWDENSLYYEF